MCEIPLRLFRAVFPFSPTSNQPKIFLVPNINIYLQQLQKKVHSNPLNIYIFTTLLEIK